MSDLDAFDAHLAVIRSRDQQRRMARRNLWLAHHWPEHYDQRCVQVGSRPVCRRCAALYPLSFLVAVAAVAGVSPWPGSIDPWMIWVLCWPATIAYGGEALGWFDYRPAWQVAATLMTALAFGRALGYELLNRWSGVFWGPIALFGGIWFLATVMGARQRAATVSSNSSSVL